MFMLKKNRSFDPIIDSLYRQCRTKPIIIYSNCSAYFSSKRSLSLGFMVQTHSGFILPPQDDKCRFRVKDVGADDTGFMDIESGSEEDLLKAVTTIGPISVAIDAGQMSFHSYSSGVYVEPKCSSKFLDHGVLVVGFGEQDGQKYWLVKNRFV